MTSELEALVAVAVKDLRRACYSSAPASEWSEELTDAANLFERLTAIENQDTPSDREGVREVLKKVAWLLGEPTDGVQSMADDEVVEHTVKVPGWLLKEVHAALSQSSGGANG